MKARVAFVVFIFVLLALACASGTPVRQAWISGYASCPSHPEYGQLVVEYAHLYSSPGIGPTTVIHRIPHGSQVEILREERGGVYRIQYKGKTGYVQSMLVVDYDPAGGVRPDESHCL